MSIPTVPGSDVSYATPERAAHLDAGALTAPARARMATAGDRFRGARETAGALEGAGDALGGIAGDMLKVRRANVAADADFRMRAAQQSFLESIKGDQKESDWGERAQQVFERTREDIYQNHAVPPGMKPELDASIKGWGQALAIRTATMAQVQTINRAEVSIRKSYDEAGRDGDAAGMANAVALGRSSKLDPVAMDELEGNIPRALATTAIENGLRANPQGTHDLLASGASLPIADAAGKPIVPAKVFAPKELESLVVQARARASAWQKDNYEALLQTDADPISGMVPDATIKAKMKSKEISEVAGRALMFGQDRKLKAATVSSDNELAALIKSDAAEADAPPAAELIAKAEKITDPAKRQETINRVRAKAAAFVVKSDNDQVALLSSRIHDPTAWGVDPENYAHEIVADAGKITDPAKRQKAINEANHQLAAVKKTGETAERSIERSMYELMSRDLAEQSAMVPVGAIDIPEKKEGFFAKKVTPATTEYRHVEGGLNALKKENFDVEGAFGPGVKKEDVVRAAELHAANIKEDMRLWFQSEEGSKATFKQANEHRQSLERPYVMDAVRASLAKRKPVLVSTPEELKGLGLPPGTPFVTPDGAVRYAK